MKVKAILYDMGDIFFEAHFWRKWMWSEFKKINKYEGDFSEFYNLYESFLLPVYKGEKDYNSAYRNFLRYIGVENIDYFHRKSFEKKKYYEDNRQLYPCVKETLRKINEIEVFNVVITDNEADETVIRETILKRFGINNFINKVISSTQFNTTKPDPIIFTETLNLLQIKKEEALFVAHDLDEINGAVKYGLKVVEYNNYLGVDTRAHFKIDSFEEIFSIINEINNG